MGGWVSKNKEINELKERKAQSATQRDEKKWQLIFIYAPTKNMYN